MSNEFEKFSFEHTYKGIKYFFLSKDEPKERSRVKALCSDCNEEKIIYFKFFKSSVDKYGKYLCTECTSKLRKDNNIFQISDFPEELQIKILSGGLEGKYLTVKPTTEISFICQDCGVEETAVFRYFLRRYRQHNNKGLCIKCGRKNTLQERYGENVINSGQIPGHKERMEKTSIEKYGKPSYTQTEEYIEKTKATNLKKYGVEWSRQNKEVVEKGVQTCLEKYGTPYYSSTEECKEKIKLSNIKKYGVEYYTQTEEFLEKTKKTNLEKYGVEFYGGTKECQDKMKQTCLERYGVENYTQTEEYKIKSQNTSLEKYGVPYYSQTKEFQENSIKKYLYKGMNFDSSWEVAYFIYNEDFNIPTIRSPQSIEYFLREESHHYFPDFLVGNQLIEIKSSAMLNPDYSLKPHFKHLNKCKTEEEKQYLYDLCAAKTQCMRENNVQILSRKEIKPYLKYIKDTYGKDYLKQFKKEKDQDISEEIDILDLVEDIEDEELIIEKTYK